MSVKVMGAVWDLGLESDEKFILLAYADHASHDGTNIFPAVSTIAEKTGYSERSVQRITRLLEEKGLLLEDGKGPHGTNKWRIPIKGGVILSPQERGVTNQQEVVTISTERGDIAVSPESSLTVNESSTQKPKIKLPEGSGVDWLIRGGVESSEIAQLNEKEQRERAVADFWEKVMGYNPLPWWSDKDLKALLVFLLGKTSEEMEDFAKWSKRPFSAFSPEKARAYPRRVIELWPRAFEAKEAEPSYYKRPAVLDEDESNYVIPD